MQAQLLIAASDDANMRYATGLLIHDPFIWARIEGKRGKNEFIIVSKLEYGKVKEQAKPGVSVLLLDNIPCASRALADIAATFLRTRKAHHVSIAHNMWSTHYLALQREGLQLKIKEPFFPERLIKTKSEQAAIARTGKVTCKAFLHALKILKASRIGTGKILRHKGKPLTSELLKQEIERIFQEHGCASGESIVACGTQAAQPHNYGSGPLRAGEPIVIDIYPRDLQTGYYFDMTRTVIKGMPSKELRHLYMAVYDAQRAGLAAVKAGRHVRDVDAACRKHFVKSGYKSTMEEGFIHSTGHGLGLQLHEPPRIAPSADVVLRQGMVITIEPGLYYKKLGGVRIEDTVIVTADGCINLTPVPKKLFIR